MTKKHYCQKCEKLIEEGKETKVCKGGGNYSSRYSSRTQNYYIYYLCRKCFQQEQQEIQAKNRASLQTIGWSLLIVTLLLIAAVILFFVYQSRQDKEIDKIAKKSQKNKILP